MPGGEAIGDSPGTIVSRSTESIRRFFRRQGISVKKTAHAAEQARPDVAAQRRLTPEGLVFLDQTLASTAMARPRGRAPRGERLVSAVPHGRWKTTTFIAGLRQAGVVAPLVLDGPMNGAAFRVYVEQMLAPTLRPGDVVIMDNLSPHKVDGVGQAIEARGAEFVCLPPYSPDLNPIEQLFSRLKALLRKVAARTVSNLWEAIGALLESSDPAECANYFRHDGYGST